VEEVVGTGTVLRLRVVANVDEPVTLGTTTPRLLVASKVTAHRQAVGLTKTLMATMASVVEVEDLVASMHHQHRLHLQLRLHRSAVVLEVAVAKATMMYCEHYLPWVLMRSLVTMLLT